MSLDYSATASLRENPLATHGMVTSPNALATQAGIDLLQRGGTALDAAAAVGIVLAVVYPQMCSLGGDAFWLFFDASAGKLSGLNASGRSGHQVIRACYQGLSAIPARGYRAVNTVPGMVSGLSAIQQYSREQLHSPLHWADLFEAGRMYAEDGFPVTTSLAHWLRIDTDTSDAQLRQLQRFSGFRETFLKDGCPYQLGEILRQPALAKSLAVLAAEGPASFYRGDIAEKILRDLRAHGGLLTAADFAAHTADWVEPLSVPYRDCTACNLPPNTQGFASLELLNILNQADLTSYPEGSAAYVHLLVEATKEAFRDRDQYLTDPAFAEIPLAELLSASHARAQYDRIQAHSVSASTAPLDPHGDTVWFGVVDAQGNAVSVIQSVYHDFGSGIIPAETGILLQNRGSFFSLDPRHVNRLEPDKRTFHTLNPAMLLRHGKPFLVYGTMGGEGQPQTQAALVTRIIDYGLSPQDAINAPRWLYGRTWGLESNTLKLESRFPPDVLSELARRGHPVEAVEPYTDLMGHAGAIKIWENGVLQGAFDPRSDGSVAGF